MINNFYYALSGRSPKWPEIRKQHLLKQPICQACGTKKGLEVHHIVPYGVNPELELDSENLITLCDKYCHFAIGHLMDYKSWNTNVVVDSSSYLDKIHNRPRQVKVLNNQNTLIYYMRRLYNYYLRNHE